MMQSNPDVYIDWEALFNDLGSPFSLGRREAVPDRSILNAFEVDRHNRYHELTSQTL